ncbi:hypothetical protein CPB85DRAFT_1374736 [Mucidula mucida]|nr:hypothetical protein CPB85DRAFT_1374736 [Mucidula mucida]
MASIGSVFLGDSKRIRVLSSSTPPSSPPPTSPSGVSIMSGMMSGMSSPHSPPPPSASPQPPRITAVVGTALRWLEAIVYGVKQNNGKGKGKLASDQTLLRAADGLQRKLDAAVQGNDGLKRFMSQYDKHAHLLTPSFALAGLLPDSPVHHNLSHEALDALITEMENDIRAADRDMQEVEALQKKGVTGAGNLASYEALEPRLEALMKAHDEDLAMAAALEKRIASIMERHATQIDALSELFVAWDDTLTDAEARVSKLERERDERRRLGLE